MAIVNFLNSVLSYPLIAVIWLYQKTLSLDHGPLRHLFPLGFCKFYPSCSVYALQTLNKRGLAGIPKIIKRLVACNPGSLGGVDLPQ